MMRFKNAIAVAAAVLVMAVIIAVAVVNWHEIGEVGIDLNGWIALILGVLVTVGLGVGLMTLIFISNRRGYDDPP
jgi:predicted Na+-dependent transporter